jgi:hypothetical protein
VDEHAGDGGFEEVLGYIKQQASHHRTHSFRDELVIMPRKHHIPFEEWMLQADAKVDG